MPSAQSENAFPATLTWSHYERLMRVTDKETRNLYMQKAAKQIDDDPLKSFLFKPTVPASENTRIFMEELDDCSMYMCFDKLFTATTIKKLKKTYCKSQLK